MRTYDSSSKTTDVSQNPISPFEISYKPLKIKSNLSIGVIGCGNICGQHLKAYKKGGLKIEKLCDSHIEKAKNYKLKYFPEIEIVSDYQQLIEDSSINIMDITTHPKGRVELIEKCLKAGKHVLSQKPFVLDIEEGLRLVNLAQDMKVKLAVNQNGRWAPHWKYIYEFIQGGHLGKIKNIDFSVLWDHSWVKDTAYDEIDNLILYDFAIHWFDIFSALIGKTIVEEVIASAQYSSDQEIKPPTLAEVSIKAEEIMGKFHFDASRKEVEKDQTVVIGEKGKITSEGPDLNHQKITIELEEGIFSQDLEGHWFPDGFLGSMTELISSIEEKREPINNAKDNLRSLELCFAAVESATKKHPIKPSEILKLNGC